MVAGNPRIEELRKRLEKEPASRLFAQLAEELRKDGELGEAVKVCRAGLAKHPNYPSARMTLGRALLDSGDMDGAREEFETVLRGAPDNILASRYLGEALEGLGDLRGAVDRYRKTLLLAPGDKAVTSRLAVAEAALASQAAEVGGGAGAAPIPLVAVESESFELEAPAQPEMHGALEPLREVAAAPRAAAPLAGGGGTSEAPSPPEGLEWREEEPVDESEEATGAPPLVSATLGELYAAQGHPEQAAAVYRELSRRAPAWADGPGGVGGSAPAGLAGPPPGLPAPDPAEEAVPVVESSQFAPGDGEGGRREALERTVDRLEGWLSVVRRGRQ